MSLQSVALSSVQSSSNVPLYRACLTAKGRRKPNLWLPLNHMNGAVGAFDDISNSGFNYHSAEPDLKSIFENWEDTPVPHSSIIVEEDDVQILLISPESSFCNPTGTCQAMRGYGPSPLGHPDIDFDAEGTTLVSALPSPELEQWEEEDEEDHGCELQDQMSTPTTKARGDSKLCIDTSFVSSLNSFSSIDHGFTLSALFLSPNDSSITILKGPAQGPDVPTDPDLFLSSVKEEDDC